LFHGIAPGAALGVFLGIQVNTKNYGKKLFFFSKAENILAN
jgi:hypothetical protein